MCLGNIPVQRLSPLQPCTANVNVSAFTGHSKQISEWSNRVAKNNHGLGNPKLEPQLIGDKTGLQGLFDHSVGFVAGKILKAQSIDLAFADFKCLGNPYANTPDSILRTGMPM